MLLALVDGIAFDMEKRYSAGSLATPWCLADRIRQVFIGICVDRFLSDG